MMSAAHEIQETMGVQRRPRGRQAVQAVEGRDREAKGQPRCVQAAGGVRDDVARHENVHACERYTRPRISLTR